MSVLDIETLGFGVSKETFDPPSFPVDAEHFWVPGYL